MIAAIRAEPEMTTPILVFGPPLPRPADVVDRGDPVIGNVDPVTRGGDLQSLRWVDIGFTIRPDGTVDTPEVLRGSPRTGWAKPLLSTIAARRYSPTTTGSSASP